MRAWMAASFFSAHRRRASVAVPAACCSKQAGFSHEFCSVMVLCQ
jgi:hypothetical protein